MNSEGSLSENLPMPAGSTVVVTSLNSSCTVESVFPASVSNVVARFDNVTQLGTSHSASLSGCVSGNRIRVLVTAPSGSATGTEFTVP